MEKQEITNLYTEYWYQYKRFMFKYNMDFYFSLDTLEKCSVIFDEIELNKADQINLSWFEFNKPWINKLCRQLNIECSIDSMAELFGLYLYNIILLNEISDYCKLFTGGMCGVEPLYDWETISLKRKNKYSNKYFYEFSTVIDFAIMPLLKTFDSIRCELLKNGDTLEGINNRDFTITLHKYYDYLGEGITYDGQPKKDK